MLIPIITTSLSQALDRAKAEVGNNDREYARKYPETFKKSNFQKRNLSFWVEIVPMITV